MQASTILIIFMVVLIISVSSTSILFYLGHHGHAVATHERIGDMNLQQMPHKNQVHDIIKQAGGNPFVALMYERRETGRFRYHHYTLRKREYVADITHTCAFTNRTKVVVTVSGPPGVGKTTIVNLAMLYGFNAFDLEDNWTLLSRLKTWTQSTIKEYGGRTASDEILWKRQFLEPLFQSLPNGLTIFNGAFFNKPVDYAHNVPVISVLLLPDWETYIARNSARDGPYQKGGEPQYWYDYFLKRQDEYPIVIRDNADSTPEITLKEICKAVNAYGNKHGNPR